MDSIKNLIQSRLKAHQLDESAQAAQVIFTANQLLQEHFPKVAEWARANRYEQSILTIVTEHASGAQALWAIQAKLLTMLNEKEGLPAIKKIVIKGLTIG